MKFFIEGRTEKVYKLKSNLVNTDVILIAQEKEKVRLPHALVRVNESGEFVTSIINQNAKTIDFSDLVIKSLEKIEENFNITTINKFQTTYIDRKQIIQEQFRLEHLNDEEKDLITEFYLEFEDIFYFEGDTFNFTNEIKHSIETNNSRPIFTKSYRYHQIHKNEVKTQINKMLNQGIIGPSISLLSSPVWVVHKTLDA